MPVDPASSFPSDPRSLSLGERAVWLRRLGDQQRRWQQRLLLLAEPAPAADFPAFLLATPSFAGLVARIGGADRRAGLPTAVADELDHFVVAYRDYLRTDAGEDAFQPSARRAS